MMKQSKQQQKPRMHTAPATATATTGSALLNAALEDHSDDDHGRLSSASAASFYKHSPHQNGIMRTPQQQAHRQTSKTKNLFARLFRMRTKSHSYRDVEATTPIRSSHAMPAVTRSTSAPVPYTVSSRVLMDGLLTKLTHTQQQRHHVVMQWHVKPTYFVLEEVCNNQNHVQMYLRQYRKRDDVIRKKKSVPISEVLLSEDDIVVDISDKYIKYGLELVSATPPTEESTPFMQTKRTQRAYASLSAETLARLSSSSSSSSSPSVANVSSIRLSAPDAVSHDQWMRAIGSAISKLILQTEKHYPINSPAEPSVRSDAVGEISSMLASLPVPTAAERPVVPAKVAPYNPHSPESDEEKPEALDDETRTSYCSCGSRCSTLDRSNQCHSNNQEEDEDEDHEWRQQYQDRLSERVPSSTLQPYSPDVTSSDSETSHRRHTTSLFMSSPNAPVPSYEATAPCPSDSNNQHDEALEDELHEVILTTSDTRGSVEMVHSQSKYPHPISFRPPLGRSQVHTFNANGQVFTLDVRYRLLKSIGTGAYGAVIAVKDSALDESVAIKKITNIFEDLVDAKRILREVRLLRHFQHKNITKLLDLAPPMSKKSFEDMYIVTELMETDLHQVIYSMQPMSDDHVKYFLYQMLCALYHIHSAGVLHRDMKPSNILLSSNCDLKVCDFGLARGGIDTTAASSHHEVHQSMELTEYVVTRWYRAPEIMLNCLQYTEAIDVWAVGCIFAEMLLREPLFPGNDYIHQLKLIIKFLGTPKQEDIAFVKNVKALRFLTKLAISKPKKWKDVFVSDDINPLALDLLSQMLVFNPAKRISVQAALQHPYLSTFFDPADITMSAPFDFSFDIPDDKLTKDALVDLLCQDIDHFHPQALNHGRVPFATANSRFSGMGMTALAS